MENVAGLGSNVREMAQLSEINVSGENFDNVAH